MSDRRRVITTGSRTERWYNYCQWPGGPGCKNLQVSGTSDDPQVECCGEGDWCVEKHEIEKTTQRVEMLEPSYKTKREDAPKDALSQPREN